MLTRSWEGNVLPNNSHYYSLDYLLSIIDEQHLFSYWEVSPKSILKIYLR